MKEALECLEDFIARDIAPTNTMVAQDCNEQPVNWSYAVVECEKIRQEIRHNAKEIKDKGALELFIQNYQASLVDLLDQIFNYKRMTHAPVLNNLYDKTMTSVEELYCFVK